jgi:hypothetical protein
MLRERKYIVGIKDGRLRHLTFPYSLHHYSFAYDNGYKSKDVIETGLIVDNRVMILECRDSKHSERRSHLRQLSPIDLKAREAQTRYAYNKELVYTLREGD